MLRVPLICILVVLHLTSVRPYTLYKWILDSRMRFNYDPDPRNALGVSNWPMTYSEDCAGPHQSPINIETDRVRYGVSCRCPTMKYDSHIMHGELKNNGHSTTFEPGTPMLLQLTDVPYLNGTYLFNDFHLHYGGVRGRDFELQGLRFRGSGVMSAGSEHTIDGLRFEGELHFVFYNSKYGSLEMADDKPDGVAIIVILVQKVPDTMTVEDTQFSTFLETNIPLVAPYLANISTTVDMTMFFNRDCEFYTYPGSTTTPACHESVRWIILKDPIQVTERAWFLLTGLQSRGDFNARFGNYRTTQPLNDRVVEANFRRSEGRALPMPNSDIVDQVQRMGQGGGMVPVDMSSRIDIPNRQLGIESPGIVGAATGVGMIQRGGMNGQLRNLGMNRDGLNGGGMGMEMPQRGLNSQSMNAGSMSPRMMTGPNFDAEMGLRRMSGQMLGLSLEQMLQTMNRSSAMTGIPQLTMNPDIGGLRMPMTSFPDVGIPQMPMTMPPEVGNPGFRNIRMQQMGNMMRPMMVTPMTGQRSTTGRRMTSSNNRQMGRMTTRAQAMNSIRIVTPWMYYKHMMAGK